MVFVLIYFKRVPRLTPSTPPFELLLHSFLVSHMTTPPSSARSAIHLFIPQEICHHRIPRAKKEGETMPA
jgi:hypothetical protein